MARSRLRCILALAACVAVSGGVAATAMGAVSADPQFKRQWSLKNTGQTVGGVTGTVGADIGVGPAWDVTTGSPSVTVADVDDGVDPQLTDLSGNLDMAAGYDFADGDGDATQEDSKHGSQTASVLGARGDDGVGMAGVAWRVRIVPFKVRVAGSGGRSTQIPLSAEAAAFRAAGDRGYRIVNASFGGSQRYSDATLAAIKAAPATLFVVSAGNDGFDVDRARRWPCSYGVPNLLCVGGTDQNDHLWSLSNYGVKTVQLAAPAANILTVSGLNTWAPTNGTSYAAPMVSGAAALYLAKYPTATVADVRRALLDGVDVLPDLVGRVSTGGRLNVARTLAIAPAGSPTPTPTPSPSPSPTPTPTPAEVPAPTVSPASGAYRTTQSVTAAGAAGLRIRYTSGSGTTVPPDPTAGSPAYASPVSVSTSRVMKFAAFDSAGRRSAVVTRAYTIDKTVPPTPSVTPSSGTYSGPQQVTMSDSEPGTVLRYAIAPGSEVPPTPTATTGIRYDGPFTVSSSSTIDVVAFDAAGNRSGIRRRIYTIR